MAKVHISKAGIPAKCPAKIQCRLAPEIGHFDKVEQAQEFADQINQLKIEQRSALGLNSTDVKNLSNAELIYTADKIKSEAAENENYKDYKGSVKWQKEVRSKASKEMQQILAENNEMTAQIGEQIDKVDKLREKYKKEKDPSKKHALYQALKIERSSLNILRDSYGPKLNENLDKFKELKNKKEIAEEKILSGMQKQALHSEAKSILADVESEIEERGRNLTDNTRLTDEEIDKQLEDTIKKIDDDYMNADSNMRSQLDELGRKHRDLKEEMELYDKETINMKYSMKVPDEVIQEINNKYPIESKDLEIYNKVKEGSGTNVLDGIENKGLKSILYRHVINNPRRDPGLELTKKDVGWINDYKNNPELMNEHLNQINSNINKMREEKVVYNRVNDTYAKIENKITEYKNSQLAYRYDRRSEYSQDLSNIAKEHNEILENHKKLREDMLVNKFNAKSEAELTKLNNGKVFKVTHSSVLSARDKDNFKIDKDKISVLDGKIDNLYIKLKPKYIGDKPAIHKIESIKNKSFIDHEGIDINPSKTLGRGADRKLKYNYMDYEILYGEKTGGNYTGETDITIREYDSTD